MLACCWEGARLPRACGKSLDFPEFPRLPQELPDNFPGTSRNKDLKSNPDDLWKFAVVSGDWSLSLQSPKSQLLPTPRPALPGLAPQPFRPRHQGRKQKKRQENPFQPPLQLHPPPPPGCHKTTECPSPQKQPMYVIHRMEAQGQKDNHKDFNLHDRDLCQTFGCILA